MYGTSFIHVNGVRLHYREWGSPETPDLLLVHGWSSSSVVWHDVAEALSDSYHIIAPDNRGNGESEVPETGYTLSHYTGDLAELVRVLGLERPYFAGNSWGANIGTYLAADRPELLSAAILEDPVYWKMVDGFVTIVPRIILRSRTPEADVRSEALARGLSPEQADREVYLSRHFSPKALGQVATVNRSWAIECDDYLARIAIPTLALVADSEAGGYISLEELQHHREKASADVVFSRWEGVGHMMHGQQPDRVVRELRRFFGH